MLTKVRILLIHRKRHKLACSNIHLILLKRENDNRGKDSDSAGKSKAGLAQKSASAFTMRIAALARLSSYKHQ
ncbi:hypothetical protein DWB58_27035 [candidate division KSB1 bacterium]|nr:hypothetical protein [candidate division KSB1 bacterium]RIK79092.1 MAG: hypothetical protein DCC62_06245 [candidate division KSB1 bacterium]